MQISKLIAVPLIVFPLLFSSCTFVSDIEDQEEPEGDSAASSETGSEEGFQGSTSENSNGLIVDLPDTDPIVPVEPPDELPNVEIYEVDVIEPVDVLAVWPDSIPLLDGMVYIHGSSNTRDGLMVIFETAISLEEVGGYYEEALADWTEIEPFRLPEMFGARQMPESIRRSGYKGDDRYELEILNLGDGQLPSHVTIMYNWRTMPGELPDNWPDSVPLMPGTEYQYGAIGDQGWPEITMVGDIELFEITNFYTGAVEGWTKMEQPFFSELSENQLNLQFMRGLDQLNVNGQKMDDETIIKLQIISRPQLPEPVD
ncbi:MAG: hypothetical protein ABIG42_05115 [bacterium]